MKRSEQIVLATMGVIAVMLTAASAVAFRRPQTPCQPSVQDGSGCRSTSSGGGGSSHVIFGSGTSAQTTATAPSSPAAGTQTTVARGGFGGTAAKVGATSAAS